MMMLLNAKAKSAKLAGCRPMAGWSMRVSAAALVAIAGLAHADVPAALDRAPANAEFTIAVKNVGQFDTKLKAMTGSLGMDAAKLGVVGQLISLPGLNKEGSAALVFTEKPGEAAKADANDPTKAKHAAEGKPQMVAVLPVSDYAGFVKGLGTETKGELKLKDEYGGRTYFIKDIGGGYAAMAQSAEELAGFEGKAGGKAAQQKLMGKVGEAINETSDAILIANMDLLRPKMEEGLAKIKEQTDGVAQMAGGNGDQMKAQLAMMQGAADAFMKDASSGIIGLGINDAGVSMDMGAQFKDGSEAAKLFVTKGDSGSIMGHLPTQPFYFAFSADLSSPGLKQLLRNAMTLQQSTMPKDSPVDEGTLAMFTKSIDTISNMGVVVGASPGGIMGGLLANTTYFVSTSKPQEMLASQKAMLEGLNGKNLNGVTYKTTYTPGATTVEGVKADQWSMQMQVDPNNPAAMQVQQVQSMIFGMGGGPGGFYAALDNGVVVTMSQNTPLLTTAIKAAKDGKGLGEDALLKDAQKNLPADRSMEGYVGVKSLLDLASGFMAMAGGGTSFQTPAQVAPIAMSSTTNGGGVRFKFFMPSSTMKTIGDFAKSFDQGADEDAKPAPAEKGKAPRF